MPPLRARARRARRRVFALVGAVALVIAQLAISPPTAHGTDAEWIPPVPGMVVVPFSEPVSRFGAGHRGVDFAAAPGTPVVASNDGTVTFAGDVAGSLHVVIAHGNGIRTSYSFLLRVDVQAGQRIKRGQVVGAAGSSGDRHGIGVLHFGVRIGERYVDPMLLFRPPDLTEMVRLVPAEERGAADTSRTSSERVELGRWLDGGSGDDNCAGGIPLVEQVCDGVEEVAEVGGDAAGAAWDLAEEAFEAGLDALRSAGRRAAELAESIADAGRGLLATVRTLTADAAEWVLENTKLGRAVTRVVQAGLFILESLTSECTEEAPPADGSGGSGNVMMAVAGIDSFREAGARRTFDFPAELLGFDATEQEWFNYRSGSEQYAKEDTYQDIRKSAALLAQQLKDAARRHPGRTFDLFGHSQGGIVIDVFLMDFYAGHEGEYPPIENVVTFASPHEGAPLATTGTRVAASPLGQIALDGLGDIRDAIGLPMPDPNARSVRQLSQDSSLIERIQNSPLPRGINFLSIAATDDAFVPADNTDRPGVTTIRLDVGTLLDSHSAVTSSPRALMAARAAIEHKALPCTSYEEKLQGAVRPALLSTLEENALSISP